MKKSIGLTADISSFNTTLPQTRHLNYFMGTNPRRYASGGDVSQGIPKYPNPNVTSGFLPMALGFDNGGDTSEKKSIFRAIISIIAKQFKKLESDEDVIATATDIVNNQPALAKQLLTQDEAYKVDIPPNAQPPTDGLNLTIPAGLTPKDTVTSSKQLLTQDEAYKITPPGGYYGAPSASSQATPGIGPNLNTIQGLSTGAPVTPKDTVTMPLPKISDEQQLREFEDSQKPMGPIPQITPPSDGGITTIDPEKSEPKELPLYLKPFDLNGDGEVNIEDYNIAKETGSKYLDAIAKFLGIIVDKGSDALGLNEDNLPKISPEQEKRDEEDRQQSPPVIESPIVETPVQPPVTDTDKGGITTIDPIQRKRDIEDKQIGITSQEQKLYKLLAEERAKEKGEPDSGEIKDKKDVPSWALPMMSAGFAMMASKSPYFMQALGEAGQAGVETYSGIKEAESKKELDKAQIEGLKARAAYDRGEGRNTNKPTIINDAKGRRVYAIFDREKNQYVPIESADGGPQYAVRSMAEIDEYLSNIHLNWQNLSEVEKQALRDAQVALDMGVAKTNVSSSSDDKSDDGNIFWDGTKWVVRKIGEKMGLKDGGIVSLRR